MAARMPIIATTIISSISVKPFMREIFIPVSLITTSNTKHKPRLAQECLVPSTQVAIPSRHPTRPLWLYPRPAVVQARPLAYRRDDEPTREEDIGEKAGHQKNSATKNVALFDVPATKA